MLFVRPTPGGVAEEGGTVSGDLVAGGVDAERAISDTSGRNKGPMVEKSEFRVRRYSDPFAVESCSKVEGNEVVICRWSNCYGGFSRRCSSNR